MDYPAGTKIEEIIKNLELAKLPFSARLELLIAEMERQAEMEILAHGIPEEFAAQCMLQHVTVMPFLGVKQTATAVIGLFTKAQGIIAKKQVVQ